MKLKILFLALFVAGIAASIALASPADNGSTGTTAPTATTATSAGKHGAKGDDGEHAKKDKAPTCRNVELRGTLAAGSLTVAVDKAGGPGRELVGSSATLTVGGHVRVSALLC